MILPISNPARLRVQPEDTYPLISVEAAVLQSFGQFPVVSTGLVQPLMFVSRTANGVKTLTKVRVQIGAVTATPVVNAYLYAGVGALEGAKPTGNWASKTGALAQATNGGSGYTLTAAWNEITFNTGGAAPDTPYAILPDTPYGILLDLVSGTSYRVSASPTHRQAGWNAMLTTAPATDIVDSVWHQQPGYAPCLQLEFSDGSREVVHMSFGASSSGNVPLHGADAFAGVGIYPDFDIPLVSISDCYFDIVGTAGSAGAVVMSIYDENKVWRADSLNQIAGTQLVTTPRTPHTFYFSQASIYTLKRQRLAYGLAHQVAAGGSASHYIKLGGGTGTGLGLVPRSRTENLYHGLHSVSSITGLGALASNATTAHGMTFNGRALVR